MKKRFKRFLSVATASTTGTLIACIFWYGICCLTGDRPLLHSWIPYLVLPEILSIGILAGGITELVMPQEDVSNREGMIRLIIHYVLVTVSVLVCGFFYGWYTPNFWGITGMCLTSAAVYLFTAAMNYQAYKRTANEMNRKLKEYHEKTVHFSDASGEESHGEMPIGKKEKSNDIFVKRDKKTNSQ